MQKTIVLEPWNEASGRLRKVLNEESCLILDFGRFRIKLGQAESEAIRMGLMERTGKRISILRTDLPDRPILMRTL